VNTYFILGCKGFIEQVKGMQEGWHATHAQINSYPRQLVRVRIRARVRARVRLAWRRVDKGL